MLQTNEDLNKKKKIMKNKTFAKSIFLLLGLAVLIPWNTVISSLSFFQVLFPNYNISFLITFPNIVATYIFGFIVIIKSEFISINAKIFLSLLLGSIVLAIQPIEAIILKKTDFGFYVFIIITFFSAGFSAVL